MRVIVNFSVNYNAMMNRKGKRLRFTFFLYLFFLNNYAFKPVLQMFKKINDMFINQTS